MRITVTSTLGDLESDLRTMTRQAPVAFAKVVRSTVVKGTRLARDFARASAGPHGKNYYKRISGEMTGPLTGEWGPTGTPKTEFVGVGFRHGHNLDLPRSADIVGPEFHTGVQRALDNLFWPGT